MNKTSVWMKMTLISDGALGRGDGLAGVVNAEIQHDRLGLPFLAGKTLKGLLTAQCAEILFAFKNVEGFNQQPWQNTTSFLFGTPGSRDEQGCLFVSDACIPDDFRKWIDFEFRQIEATYQHSEQERERQKSMKRAEVLKAFTAIRNQTAMNAQTGAPQRNSLRATRVVLRQIPLIARFDVMGEELSDPVKGLLAACVQSLRRVGGHRNRGFGKVSARLYGDQACTNAQELSQNWLSLFEEQINGKMEVRG